MGAEHKFHAWTGSLAGSSRGHRPSLTQSKTTVGRNKKYALKIVLLKSAVFGQFHLVIRVSLVTT
jgi:hypothetical protein